MKKICIVDQRLSLCCEAELMRHGFHTVRLPENKRLSEAVRSHTDMLLFPLYSELFFTAEYCEDNEDVISRIFSLLPNYKFNFTPDRQQAKYPNDCSLNALLLGKKLFARLDSLSPSIKRRAEELGIFLINTNQGYPACTALKLNDFAVITADRGLADALSENGIRVTLIEQGHITLPPYQYGFIGGAGAVFEDTLYFIGDHNSHPSKCLIEAAAQREGLSIVDLAPGCALRDLGGMFFAYQNI